MRKNNTNFNSAFVLFVALQQLAVQSMTVELHICCDHGCDVAGHVSNCEQTDSHCHACSCGRHSNTRTDDSDSSQKPHDPNSCPVCQVAFAVMMVDLGEPPLASAELFELLVAAAASTHDRKATYRWLSRGPPVA